MTVIRGVIRLSSFKTAKSFLPSNGRPALLAQSLGVRLNGAKCGLQRRRYDRRRGMRCFFPRKGSGRDPHCFSLRGDRASPSRCYFLRHHPLQFGTVSRCRSRRQENWPSPPQCDACVENCRPELGRQLEWCAPLYHVGKAQQGHVCSVRRPMPELLLYFLSINFAAGHPGDVTKPLGARLPAIPVRATWVASLHVARTPYPPRAHLWFRPAWQGGSVSQQGCNEFVARKCSSCKIQPVLGSHDRNELTARNGREEAWGDKGR